MAASVDSLKSIMLMICCMAFPAVSDGLPAAIHSTADSTPDIICFGNEQEGVEKFETDINLSDEQKKVIQSMKDQQSKSQGLSSIECELWPNATLPYVISGSLEQGKLMEAFHYLESRTCIKFIPRTAEEDYVFIGDEEGCSSSVGRRKGRQYLSLSARCYTTSTAIHEIIHALGVWHEQSRPDRDQFVRVEWGNIVPGYSFNFYRYTDSFIDSLNITYDLKSIMHYSEYAFSRNGRKTIVPLQEVSFSIGRRSEPSDIDIKQLNLLYNCSSTSSSTSSTSSTSSSSSSSNSAKYSESSDDDDLSVSNNDKNNDLALFPLLHTVTGKHLSVQEINHGYTLDDPIGSEYEAIFTSHRLENRPWSWDTDGHLMHISTNLCLSSKPNGNVVLKSCHSNHWRTLWFCNGYSLIQPESGYCLTIAGIPPLLVTSQNESHSLERLLEGTLSFHHQGITHAKMTLCNVKNIYQKFAVNGKTNESICSLFPSRQMTTCYTENTMDIDGWMRCNRYGHYASGFQFLSNSSSIIIGLICCISPRPINEQHKRNVISYPLSSAVECFHRSWWTSASVSQFQCAQGEYLHGLLYTLPYTIRQVECCKIKGRSSNGYRHCEKKQICEGSGIHLCGYRYDSNTCFLNQKCMRQLECCY